MEPGTAGLWEEVGSLRVWAALHPLIHLGEGLLKAGLQTVCPGTTWPPQGLTDPSPGLQPWLEGSWASELEKREDLFLIVLLSPQSETVCVNLEMGDQKAWALVGHLSSL